MSGDVCVVCRSVQLFAFVLSNSVHRNKPRSIFSTNQSQAIKLVSYTYCFSIFAASRAQKMSASESGLISRIIREFETTTATATGTPPNKRFNEQNNGCARAF